MISRERDSAFIPLVHTSHGSSDSENEFMGQNQNHKKRSKPSSTSILVGASLYPDSESVFSLGLDEKAKRRQTVATLCFCLGAFAMGNAIGWASPSISQLQAGAQGVTVTVEQGGWIGALVCLGGALQGPVTGWIMVRFGRKKGMGILSVPLFIGWLCIYTADDVWMLYLGRLMTGFASGGYSVIVPIYIGEIADPSIRGALGTLFQLMVVTGILVTYVLGSYLSWQSLSMICSLVPVVLVISIFFIKDSPTSYMSRGRLDLSRKAIVWFRNSPDIEDELHYIQKSCEEARRSANVIKSSNILCITDPVIRKPVYLTMFILLNTQLSGINAVVTFTANIFKSSGSSLNPDAATVIVGLVQLVATFLSSKIVNKTGRRPTLIWTQSVMIFSLLLFGTFFYMKASTPDIGSNIGWIPIAAMVTYVVAFSFGLGPLSWILLGELLSPKIAGVAGSLASMVNWSVAFLVTICFNYLTMALGDYGTYWLFAMFCALGNLVIWKYLPETRGKSLKEIQDNFRR